ncbi:Immunity protein 63 [Rubritalea squalenifaciens DSM 18772]|uniref:Immunity protein 63 n=1 Tax=Rubritalea squalenifaciens DSM 18772 TaxID=1123071 RepID=A0A1M6CIV0_9BACT|nr:Imm63 family immunity protein [Rubritalea squalenifaciens]SHI60926.1 Immunity protein 63 [Rubritalea squalenifaciens DSM 18772]
MKDTSGGFSTTPQHDGTPHIELVGDEFHFVVTERGSEFERRRTRDADEILYWLFEGFTQGMATDYELKHRNESRDGREIWFPYQERLLANLNPEWGARKQEAHMRILRDHPKHQNNQANKPQHPTA